MISLLGYKTQCPLWFRPQGVHVLGSLTLYTITSYFALHDNVELARGPEFNVGTTFFAAALYVDIHIVELSGSASKAHSDASEKLGKHGPFAADQIREGFCQGDLITA